MVENLDGKNCVALEAFFYIPEEVIEVHQDGSIQAAIDSILDGGCILVHKNQDGYEENLIIDNKILTILGEVPENPGETIIWGASGAFPIVTYTMTEIAFCVKRH